MGLEAVFIKRLSSLETTIRILFINNGFGAMLAVTGAVFVWVPPSTSQWGLLILLGLIMVTAQTFFIQAMKSADASYVIPFFYATLVFAALYDFGVFAVVPGPLNLVGAATIIAGALFLAYRERQLKSRAGLSPEN